MENLNQEIMEMESTIDECIEVDDLVMVDDDSLIIAEDSLMETNVDEEVNVTAVVAGVATGLALAYGARYIYRKIKEKKLRKKMEAMRTRIVNMLTVFGDLDEYTEEEIDEMALYNCFREMNGKEFTLYCPRKQNQ